MEMRLQRFLAQAGVASRRKAEELIAAGRVKVNGKVVAELGSKVDPERDQVSVGGRPLHAESHVYLLLNKPKGYVTTVSDPEGRPTVMELVSQVEERVYPVGRLDYNTEGLLLLTNDGDLANALMHPKREVEKTYQVKLQGLTSPETLSALASGVTLDDGERTAPAKVQLLGTTDRNSWLEITIHEGKNRQVHRMAEAVNYRVLKLQRVRYAGLEVGDLAIGRFRNLVAREVELLRKAAGLKKAPGRDRTGFAKAAPRPKAHAKPLPARPHDRRDRPGKPAHERASGPAHERPSRPGQDRGSRPAHDRASRPAPDRASRPAPDRASRPAHDRASRPAPARPRKPHASDAKPRRR
jgi:pseudouridine synthase